MAYVGVMYSDISLSMSILWIVFVISWIQFPFSSEATNHSGQLFVQHGFFLLTVSPSLLTGLFCFPSLFRKCLLTVLCGARCSAEWTTMLRLISLLQLRLPYMPLSPQGKLYPAPMLDSKLVFKRCYQQALEIIASWVCRAQSPRESQSYSYPLLTMGSLPHHWWISGGQIANLRHSS